MSAALIEEQTLLGQKELNFNTTQLEVMEICRVSLVLSLMATAMAAPLAMTQGIGGARFAERTIYGDRVPYGQLARVSQSATYGGNGGPGCKGGNRDAPEKCPQSFWATTQGNENGGDRNVEDINYSSYGNVAGNYASNSNYNIKGNRYGTYGVATQYGYRGRYDQLVQNQAFRDGSQRGNFNYDPSFQNQ